MQGFNMGRYVPPDQEGLTTGNKLAGKHPLGARARHLRTTGALTVRFEMPFAVWCTTCKPHETIIGQGVRFNAEKKKVGNYHSTPIYSFRMKHTPCGGWIEIRTDPQNTAYVVTEGGRKRDTGDDREPQLGEIAIRLGAEGAAKAEDAFGRLEGKVEDKRRAETESSRILELQERQDRDWDDPYELSRRLRRTFRAERKGLERAEAKREALKDKMSLGIELVDETDEDRLRAGMVDFGTDSDAVRVARNRPMFEPKALPASSQKQKQMTESWSSRHGHGKSKHGKRPKAVDLLAERKALFRSELTGNTRAALDPFLSNDGSTWRPEVKRRKTTSNKPAELNKDGNGNTDSTGVETGISTPSAAELPLEAEGKPVTPGALVHYASDSE